MSLDDVEIKKIAHLARLNIDEADIPLYLDNLSNILNLVDQLSEVDTQGISPMAHPIKATQRLREDKATEINQREHFQENAPAVEKGLFLVPQVID